MTERRRARQETLGEVEAKIIDPHAAAAFDFLTNKADYTDKSYDEIMEMNTDVYALDQIERRRGRYKSEHTLFLSELLIGSQFSDNQFFNELVQEIARQPSDIKPDQIVISGLYMGDFGG